VTVPRAKFGLSNATFNQRLAETIAWCSAQELIGDPEEDANTIQRRDMSRSAAELLSLAYKADPSLFAQRNWIWRWMNWSKIRRARKMKAEAERLFAVADPVSIEPPLRPQLRNSEFRSCADSLFQPGENRTELVEALADKRASLLRDLNAYPAAVSSDLVGGRLLVYEPDSSIEDGASEYMSKGYFDERDAPPWDTWVCYFDHQLISWVPPCLLDLVQAGIATNPVDCIRWLENAALAAEVGC
jgi:hypothetical protein